MRVHEVLRQEHELVPPGSADEWWSTPEAGYAARPAVKEPDHKDDFVLADGTGLAARITALLATRAPDAVLTDDDSHYVRLAEWVREARRAALPPAAGKQGAPPAADPAEVTEAEICRVLTAKLERDLPAEEVWLRNADLRPFTRGLLKRHLHPRLTVPERIRGGEPSPDAKLNRLLLEDAFVKHVVRQDDARLRAVLAAMRQSGRAALCLSGGGIRSATFALGLVQGLARHGVLGRFGYLSTVSGGGYLGSWLSAWSRHEGFDQVVAKLGGGRGAPHAKEAAPVSHLRQYSNYLSPRLGLMSGDTWTLAATYLRNLLLIWMVLVPLLAAGAAVPWFAAALMSYRPTGKSGVELWTWIAVLAALSAGFAARAIAFVHANRPETAGSVVREEARTRARRDQAAFLRLCLAPLLVATALWAVAWYWFSQIPPGSAGPLTWLFAQFRFDPTGAYPLLSPGLGLMALGGAAIHLTGWAFALRVRSYTKTGLAFAAELLAIFVTGLIAGFLVLLTSYVLQRLTAMGMQDPAYATFAVPGYLTAVMLAGFAFEGLSSRRADDSRREWNARHSAWLLIATLAWLALAGIVLFGPHLVLTRLILPAASGVGAGAGILTAVLGRSTRTGAGGGAAKGEGKKRDWGGLLSRLTLPVAAAVAVVALVIALSLLDMALMRGVCAWEALAACRATEVGMDLPMLLKQVPAGVVLGVATLLYVFGRIASEVVETNRFSLHAMYRARLIRAYLGASRPAGERRADPFTGFDDADNLYMGCLAECDRGAGKGAVPPPFHVLNLALNLVAGRNLAWQERKAASFTVSPLHAGTLNLGYRPTRVAGKECGEPDPGLYGGKRGISLGTAMTISGAAASPNMGYHSSPAITFLMTLFNARLGWWLGNPGPAGDETFNDASPRSALRPLLDEMLGATDDTNEYVYLSDGGHFENLGLYEMVLRRNRFVLVSDAGCDETCSLEDLGNAIRKIRIDLGVPIDFSGDFRIRARSADPSAPAGQYWAFGRIRYSAVDAAPGDDADELDGVLLYVK
ncbi:MAG TPA: hypothetical protein VJT67_05795, partial [Longimicrobiaceae bacterium]|nr:hypothetical protein [Longimicrobiaceae bacterium]